MAATVDIAETNGTAPGTRTDGITNSNYGAADTVNLNPDANPMPPSTNSFQKWQQWKLTALGGSSQIKTLKYYASAGLATGATHKFNGHTTQGTYDTSKKTVYETPDQLSAESPNTVPTTAPGSANIGIGGSLTGNLSSAGTYSDFIVVIVVLDGTATAGTTVTITYGYDEVA